MSQITRFKIRFHNNYSRIHETIEMDDRDVYIDSSYDSK